MGPRRTLALLAAGLDDRAIALAPIIFGEEFGRRGYLQARLLSDRFPLAALVTGVIWGIWPYPLILLGGEPTADPFLTFAVFPIATTTTAVFLGLVRLRTGSVWPGCVAHAASNGTEDNLDRLASPPT